MINIIHERYLVGIVTAIAVGIQATLLPLLIYRFDVELFILWGHAIQEYGLSQIYDVRFPNVDISVNYPPVFLYVLWWLGKFAYPLSPVIIKLPALIFNAAAGVFVWYALRASSFRIRWISALLVFFGPTVVFVFGFWGQVDIMYTLFAALAFFLGTQKRWSMAAVLMALAVFTKLQAVVFVPLLIAAAVYARASLVRPILAGLATAAVLAAPFALSGQAADLLHPFFGVITQYPYLTANAMNLWWPISANTPILDSTLFFGIPGIVIGVGLVTLAWVWALWFLYRNRRPADVFFAAAFMALAFFFFATEMHERYLFPVFVLLPLAFPAYMRWGFALWAMLTASSVANLSLVLLFGNLWSHELAGVARFALLDVWWIVNAAALIIMIMLMARKMFYAKTASRASRVQ